ncbi:MAG: hypothetical protein A2452_01040 [Candidatus Firestonebacteria bacterium RIFOXYC2_FULL_39_67]|nr:MAG: hypothetical protein A2536_11105 [Candidatus Firestonebacteria bacterium RIFOXYD2_FULL_39_29]OGF52207.1 MAG: hypothetical protein A2497_02075 [Candidatus Firestonebacteria bacterium RifOxyC12_full_39_7]OGF54065.1 MAG: hypothetical protein A2452_01040 [Candidatus Firestonebacteria bacterium RIFOXYC2_FULL_39_67]
MIKMGVIGACGIAKRRTIPEGILKAKNVKLVALMDVQKEAVKETAKQFKVKKYYTKEEDLINDKDVQAVYIAAPTYLHAELTIKAAKAGKHVFVEKPMAMNPSECKVMINECKKNKVKLMVGFLMRFHAYHQKIKELIDGGIIGSPVLARAQLSCWYPEIKGAWRQDLKLGGGGSIIDMGMHCIDLLRMLMGEVTEVSAFTANTAFKYKTEDNAVFIMKFKNNALAMVDSSFCVQDFTSNNVLEIFGLKGAIKSEFTIGQSAGGKVVVSYTAKDAGYEASQSREEKEKEIIYDSSNVKKEDPVPVNTYKSEIEHFADCIEKDKEPLISGEEGLRIQEIVAALYESAKTGKKVKV